jgi:hypothetical protein
MILGPLNQGRLVAHVGANVNSILSFCRGTEGKRPHERARHRWECIKMDLIHIYMGFQRVDWMIMVRDGVQLFTFCLHGNEPSCFIKGRKCLYWPTVISSRKTPAPWL